MSLSRPFLRFLTACRATTTPRCVRIGRKINTMRTNIGIDDDLMAETLKVTGRKSKRVAVAMGLRALLPLRRQQEIHQFRGALACEGNLYAPRIDR